MKNLTLDTKLTAAELVVEESDENYDDYKSIHRAGCTRVIDPEAVSFSGGTVADLLDSVVGLAVVDDCGQEDLDYIVDHRTLKPCAAMALGL